MAELKSGLNYIIEAIHLKREYGSSLYEAIELFEKNIEEKDKIVFSKEFLETVTKEKVDKWEELLRQYGVAIEELGEYAYHPLVGYEGKEYSIELRSALQEDLNTIIAKLDEAKANYDEILAWSGISDRSKEMLDDLLNIVDVTNDKAALLNDLMNSQNYSGLVTNVENLVNTGKEYTAAYATLSTQYEASVFDYNVEDAKLRWKQAECSWFIPKFFG